MGEVYPAFFQAPQHRPKPTKTEAEGIPLIDLSVLNQSSVSEDDLARLRNLQKAATEAVEEISRNGLKVLDDKVENFASGAWQALGNAFKGGSTLVHQLENSALIFAESVQHGSLPGSTPSIIEIGKALTDKGMQVLELVGKETLDLLISETGMDTNKRSGEDGGIDDDQYPEEVTFDRCFYIYGGPEQLEELEALSNHYALLFNRRKAKLSSEQISVCGGKLKQVQQIFYLTSEFDGSGVDSEKWKKVDAGVESTADEIKTLHDSSVKKAAELAAGYCCHPFIISFC
ncbi:OLC1v1003065C1 [Oldenlandia corymbosa var. corymbosa]|uniref:OLC1v1003065C1 n=1 Tax=Oldenlandia corymbosa var. corymbosa TaxID=529605 RepID=A0AAV1D9Z6_OLDCO|nr:OLC1v1003065C1 [Oldenlandia corymbosa var. corymbosa]